MINLPNLDTPFEYENNFYLSSNVNRMAKIMAHYDLFKQTIDLPGDIVECGVFKGASFVRFAAFRELLCNPASKKLIGFDAFGEFPSTNFELDQKPKEIFVNDSGSEGISIDQLYKILDHKKVNKNVELIKGDVNFTIPEYIKNNPHLRISFLNIDVDVYEATKTCIEKLFDMVVKGGVIVFDDYASIFPGANKAIEDFLKDKNYFPKRFPYCVTPCYIIK
jgi:hypothetical protein